MRIAIAAEGTRGDIHPMLALAERLIAAGHFVRFCAPPDFGDVVARAEPSSSRWVPTPPLHVRQRGRAAPRAAFRSSAAMIDLG